MQCVLPCGPYSRGNQANMYLQQRITLQQNPPFASFKCTSTNLCFQHNSVISQSKINSCLKHIRLKTSPAVAFTLSTSWKFNTVISRIFLLHKYAQVCRGYFIKIQKELLCLLRPISNCPPPAFPGQWNYGKLYLCWLKQMLSCGNRRDFHTGLHLFSFHTKILPPIREPSCSVSGKLI